MALSAPVAIALYAGPELCILYNEPYSHVIGVKHPHALGQPGVQVFPEVWPIIGPQLEQVRDQGAALQLHAIPLRIARGAGGAMEDSWFDYALSPVYGDGGQIIAVIAIVTEVTSAVMAEAALRQEQRWLADVFRDTPSFLAVMRGADNVFELVNPAYEQIIGHGRNSVGKPLLEALPEMAGQGFDVILEQVRRTGQPLVFREMPVIVERQRGAALEQRFVDVTYLPLVEADGSHDAVIAHGTDVTEQVHARREVERLLLESEAARTALEDAGRRLAASERNARSALDELEATYATAPVGMAVLDAELRYQRINTRLAETNGPAAEAHRGRTVRDIVPALADVVEPRLRRVLETGIAEYGVEISGETPAAPGVIRHWVNSWLPLHDRDGTVVGINVVAEEVTERHHAAAEQERLLQETLAAHAQTDEARRAAEAANQAKAEFLTMMSHELRTPLNAIGGYADLIELGIRGPVTPEQISDLARIKRSQRHLLGLINGVLNFAKLDAGSVEYNIESVSLHEVLGVCESLILPQLHAKRLSLTMHCDQTLPSVAADREKTQQVLLNLLSNALKFTDAGGRITLECGVDARGRILACVSDTGRGIAPEQLERIFQPFVQVDAALTRATEGTGLGLAISRDLARGMGGELTVTSAVGVGSTFTLALPAVVTASV